MIVRTTIDGKVYQEEGGASHITSIAYDWFMRCKNKGIDTTIILIVGGIEMIKMETKDPFPFVKPKKDDDLPQEL